MNPPNKKNHIVVIESNTKQQELLKNFLRDSVYELTCFDKGSDAFAFCKKDPGITLFIIDGECISPPFEAIIGFLKNELRYHSLIMVSCLAENIGKEHFNSLPVIRKPFTAASKNEILEILSKTDQKKYGLGYLNTLSGGEMEIIETSLHMFKNWVGSKLKELHLFMQKEDFSKIKDITHTIKPSFKMLENSTGANLCDEINYRAKNEEIPYLVEKLKNEYSDILAEIKKDFPNS